MVGVRMPDNNPSTVVRRIFNMKLRIDNKYLNRLFRCGGHTRSQLNVETYRIKLREMTLDGSNPLVTYLILKNLEIKQFDNRRNFTDDYPGLMLGFAISI